MNDDESTFLFEGSYGTQADIDRANAALEAATGLKYKFVMQMTRIAPRNGHLYDIGDRCVLRDMSEAKYNGLEVTVVEYREDGAQGLCYYVEGEGIEFNWIYEKRMLRLTP